MGLYTTKLKYCIACYCFKKQQQLEKGNLFIAHEPHPLLAMYWLLSKTDAVYHHETVKEYIFCVSNINYCILPY